MTVYSIDYMKKNPATKRQVKVTKYRGQLKFGGKTYSKLFDYESAAESWVKAKYEELSGLAGIGKWIDEIKQITMADLLKEHFKQRLAAQSPSSYKTNQNRCLRAIPAVRIPYQLISKRIDKYKFTNEFAELFFKEFYNTTPTNYVKEGIPFGEFTVESVDMQLISAYIQSRKVKPNTLLRELSTISGAFTHAYKYFKEFEDGIDNPVKRLPRGEKPKPDNNRKTVINEEQTLKIAEYLGLKANQEPYYCFIQCIYSGCRRVEALSMLWENINWKEQTFLVPKTKNGKPRDIPIEPNFFEYLQQNKKANGKVFRLTFYNMRAYWVEATKHLGYYDNERERLYFHDTRRTAITNNLRQAEGNSFKLAKVFGLKTTELEKQKRAMDQDISAIIRKLQNREALTPKEISLLAGHGSTDVTNDTYNADR
jgi:integrase